MFDELHKNYDPKILSTGSLTKTVGKFGRKKKLVMCHGVFDVVHPGHIRHLAYAKSKADLLLVSITCDRWINKGPYRPHVPERLRALSLAALDMVDYVIIDDNKSPLINIDKIQPDFFAKGFEYSDNLPKATLDEIERVKSFGGEMLFTPGDVVYSSTKLISSVTPNLKTVKLKTMMQQLGIGFGDIENAVTDLSDIKAHIVGDTIVDSFTRTTLIGGNTKTPTFSVKFDRREDYVGGAGIVAQHVKAAGAEVVFSTLLGGDDLGAFVRDTLEEQHIELNVVIDKNRPTTNKNAVICGDYRLLKIDTLDNASISADLLQQFVGFVADTPSDCLIFSDFRHGIFNKGTISALKEAIPLNTFSVADSQLASRWGNITEFKDFNLVTPNEREARFSVADQDCNIVQLSHLIKEGTNSENVILKLGAKGLFFIGADVYHSIDSFAENVIDPVGSGDALLAYSSLVLKKTSSLPLACLAGSLAAACECEIDGNIPITPEDILKKLDSVKKSI